MRKSISLLIASSMMLSSTPMFAQSASSSSSSSTSSVSSSVSSSSSSTSSVMKPCADKKGLLRAACVLERAKAKARTRNTDRTSTEVHERIAACRNKTGLEKAKCLRGMMNKVEKKMEKVERRIDATKSALEHRVFKKVIKFDIRKRDDIKHMWEMKSSKKSSRSSSSSSSSSVSSSSSSSSSSASSM